MNILNQTTTVPQAQALQAASDLRSSILLWKFCLGPKVQ